MSQFRIPLTMILCLFAVRASAQALQQTTGNPRLASPRTTVRTFLHWQQPATYRPEIAAETFLAAAELSLDDRITLARKLKRVLDARGLYVFVEQIPDNPAYTDSLTGEPVYPLFPQLPEVVVRKIGNDWLFAPETIAAVPALYRATFSAWAEYAVDRLPDFMKRAYVGVALWQIAAVFLIILLGLVLRKLTDLLLQNFARRLMQRTRSRYDEKILESSRRPLGLLVMTLFYIFMYPNLQFGVNINLALRVATQVLLYASIIWLFYRLIDVFALYLSSVTSKTESKLDDQLVPLLRKTLKIFLVALGTIFALQNLNVNVTSLLTGLGLGGLAFALAARDTLANFFGSVTIFVDKPFQVGDWIISGNVEGTVEEVGFRSTRIRTFYNSVMSVPNAKLADAAIDNMGLRIYRRVKTVIGLTYGTTAEQVQAFVEGIQAIILANPCTRKDFYEVHFNEFGNYSLNILVYFFFKVENWSQELRERHNVLLEILRLAEKLGVEFAFPTQTLHIDSFYGETPRAAGKDLAPEQLGEIVHEFGPGGALSRAGGPQILHRGRPVDYRPGRTDRETRGSA